MNAQQKFGLNKSTTTYLRAVAILAVIVGHIFGGIISDEAVSLLGNSGVTIFLLISGYGLYTSYKTKGMEGKVFWSSKIKKIFIPYAVITIAHYAVLVLANQAPELVALMKNIFCIDYIRTMDGSMWYMSFLLIWYALFFAVFYFDYPDTAKMILLFLFSALFQRRWNQEIFENCAAQFSTHAYAFPIGVFIGFVFQKINLLSGKLPKIFNKIRVVCYAIVLICLCLFVLGLLDVFTFNVTQNGILLFVILYFAFSWLKPGIPVFSWLGENSFILYLIEMKVLFSLNKMPGLKENMILFCLVYAVAAVMIVFVYQFAEKGLNYLNGKMSTEKKQTTKNV